MVVELPELGVSPVHIPLVVLDADVHLRTNRNLTDHQVCEASKTDPKSRLIFFINKKMKNLKKH